MIDTDLGRLLRGRKHDVCVIGSGPAGMTIALRLAARGVRVLMLEAGDLLPSETAQSQLHGEVVGEPAFSLTQTRQRALGGASTHWSGWCRPLDAADFGPKRAAPDCAWPFGRHEIDRYVGDAQSILELGPFAPDVPLGDGLRSIGFRYSPPVNFARKFRSQLSRSEHLHVCVQACVVDLAPKDGRIVAAAVVDGAGQRHMVAARCFIVCGGGIENSRLLLWANARNQQRVVPEPAALGRYWMEHPTFVVGDGLLATSPALPFDERGLAWVAPSEDTLQQRSMLNCGMRIYRVQVAQTRRLLADLICAAPALGYRATALLRRTAICGFAVTASWEQAPQRDNRIELGDARDAFGVPRTRLHWTLGDAERATARDAAELLGVWLARAGVGRLRIHDWLRAGSAFPDDDEIVGSHHMGGTRMHVDPRRGVVDENLRVHGQSNLYVCGSSVFPSGGFANPTFTIVQLACRLADHLGSDAGLQALA